MESMSSRVNLLEELEGRQDKVLRELDALNERLERLLAEFKPAADARVIPMAGTAEAPAKKAA